MANKKSGKSVTVLPPLNHVLRSQLEKSSSSVSDISDMSQESQLLLDLILGKLDEHKTCLLYTSPSPRDKRQSRMPSSA